MKKIFLLMSIGLLLLAGCSKENTDSQIEEQTSDLVYVHTFDGDNIVSEAISLDEYENIDGNSSAAEIRANGNSVHTHGEFHGFSGSTFSFSGTQNNGGAHGSAEIVFVRGPGPGGPGGTAHFLLETVAVVIGNIGGQDGALYGGIVTEVIMNTLPPPPPPPPGNPPPPCNPYDVGSYFYFLVNDNGQGNNAPADQYRNAVITSCDEASTAGLLNFLNLFFFSWNDVQLESDHIKVNY